TPTFVLARHAPAAEYDRSLAWAALVLAATGLVMVYSASIATAEANRYTGNSATWFLVRHVTFLGAALIAALTVFLVPVKVWQRLAPLLFICGVTLLVAVLIPGVGREANGARRWPALPMLGAGFTLLVLASPYRMQRIFGYMDPWSDAFGSGYQLSHALIAFGRGEWLGVGLGASVEKLHYLPEAHTDFLLAVLAEELGFVGVALVIALFAWIVARAFAIARQAASRERHFAALAAQGIGIWLGFQAFINMGVNMGLLPTKGLTLPLMSYGGSGLVVNFVALALLLRLDWEK